MFKNHYSVEFNNELFRFKNRKIKKIINLEEDYPIITLTNFYDRSMIFQQRFSNMLDYINYLFESNFIKNDCFLSGTFKKIYVDYSEWLFDNIRFFIDRKQFSDIKLNINDLLQICVTTTRHINVYDNHMLRITEENQTFDDIVSFVDNLLTFNQLKDEFNYSRAKDVYEKLKKLDNFRKEISENE